MIRQWLRIRSWHLTAGITSRGGQIKVLCGRWASPDAEQADDRPAGKTCESCLRSKVGR